jgi:integrase
LPIYLSRPQLKALLEVFDRRTLAGKRDYAVILCLARLGLRVGELARLSLEDVDWRQGCLRLAAPKGRRERLLPLPEEVGRALAAYLRSAPAGGTTRRLFRSLRGQRPLQAASTFLTLRQQLNWQHLRPRPRLHDLRHTFAVECLLGWYRQGQEELNAKILSLAAYLGHRNIRHAYWYLTAVPELLALGSARWAKALDSQKGAAHE